MEKLKLKNFLHQRPKTNGIDVLCKLQHFAIITYTIEPETVRHLIPERFELDVVIIDGKKKSLLSVVPFIDVDFTSAVFPFFKFTMGQTNYRIYIIDKNSGEKCVWFLGTTLDSWTLAVPRYLWNLPWHSGKVTFNCSFDHTTQLYSKYQMNTEAQWAPAAVELFQESNEPLSFEGFPDTETALVYLTHPLAGFYHRRDGKLGTYRVWHKELKVSPAKLKHANFGLLTHLNILSLEDQQKPHSVLIEPINEFTIYLPPKVLNQKV